MSNKRVAVSGMAINTPLGDTLDGYFEGLLAGRSAITNWRFFENDGVYSKVGADLSGYDVKHKLDGLKEVIDPEMYRRTKRLLKRAPFSTQISLALALDAWRDAGLVDADIDLTKVGVIVAGHNINSNYAFMNRNEFVEEPDFIDGMFAVNSLDTDHAGCVSEAIGAKGPIFTLGAACASGNLSMRSALDEIRHHGCERVLIVGAVLDMAPMDLHAMALLGAITYQSFNDEPQAASRPFDVRREGFVPAHGGAVLVVEDLELAERRGARIHAEVLAAEANADACHLPQPSKEGQARLMRKVLHVAGIKPEQIDFIGAHATSTPLGDLTETLSIKEVFGKHAYGLKVNAIKSMLGHTCWAAATVESVAAILQMNAGKLHPSINVDEMDPGIDLDVCRGKAVDHDVRLLLKNSFGFGGINCVSLLKKYEG